jgi:stage V sporulation protein B
LSEKDEAMPGYEGVTATELGVNSASVATFIVFSKAFSIVVGGLTFIAVARLLGPSSYGIYTIAMGMAGFIGAFGSISIGQYLNKYIPELLIKKETERIKRMLGAAVIVNLAAILVVILLSAIFARQILQFFFHNTVAEVLVYVTLVYLFVSAFYGLGGNVLISFADGKGSAVAQVINISIQAAMSISLVLLGYGAFGAIVGCLMGLLFGLVYQILRILHHSAISLKGVWIEARKMLGFSVPLTLSGIVGSAVNNFSILYLSIFFLPGVVGLYGVASKIGTYIDLVTGSISAILIPMFSAALASKHIKDKLGRFYDYSLYFGFLFALPIVVYISIFSNAMIISVFTSTYNGASLYIAAIGIGILLGLFASYASSLSISAGYIMQVFKFGIATSMLELLALLVLIPMFGVTGLIISIYYVGALAADAFYLYFLIHTLKLKSQFGIIRLIATNAVLAAILLPIAFLDIKATYQLLLGVLILVFVYPMLLGAFRAISTKELELLRKVVSALPVFGAWLNAIIIYAELFQRESNGL